jgi:hypothetical protein
MEDTGAKRYIAHDYFIGRPVLIDRVENSMSFYDYNIHGQIYCDNFLAGRQSAPQPQKQTSFPSDRKAADRGER